MESALSRLSEEILSSWQVRKNRKQKSAFRAFLAEGLASFGISSHEEKGGDILPSTNIIVGDVENAEVIFTAHYDTCAVLPFPNFITPRNILIYILYQLLLTAFILVLVAIPVALSTLLVDSLIVYLAALVLSAYGVLWLFVAGPANRHTANDNTSGVITLIELMARLPEECRARAAFVFFDNEETGLFGSAFFKKEHKGALKNKLVMNFDCVSDGDVIMAVLPREVRKDKALSQAIADAFASGNGKEPMIVSTMQAFYPSDQVNFKRGVGVAALKRSKLFGCYLDRIHTPRDTVFDRANILYLAESMKKLMERI